MAYRDKSQGVGFVYVDIKKLLEESRKNPTQKPIPMPVKGPNVINLNRDPKPHKAPLKAVDNERFEAIQEVKKNLDRLQQLHHKLHTMLEELNQATKKKK